MRQLRIPAVGVGATCAALALVMSCGGRSSGTQANLGSATPGSDRALVQSKDVPDGLDLRVSNGVQGAPAFDRTKLAPAKSLSEAEAAAILGRAKPLAADASDQKAFALRPGSQPAPRTGQMIKAAFPGPPSQQRPPAASDAGTDLQVLRAMPEGKVPLAPELSVTFSQPMVAVTSQSDAAAAAPVKLSPQPRGAWRWIGTRTVLFDPEIRFPQATTYTVEVPAGTRSAGGGVLKAAKKFTFETPPPSIAQSYPDGSTPQRLDVPMFVRFDQKIDPAAVLPHIKVTAGGAALPIQLLDAGELAKHKELAAMIEHLHTETEGASDGRWLAFRTTQPFVPAAAVTVEVEAGTPSAEGPNTTPAAQSFGFHTYPPLKIEEALCGYNRECHPGMPFTIRFNNPLDEAKFDEAQLAITPAIPDVRITQQHNGVYVQGMTTPHTQYRIVVSGSVLDQFGQTLGQDRPLTFDVGAAQPTFFGPSGMVVLDPAAKRPSLDFFSTNYTQLKVKLYRVTDGDVNAYATFLRNQWNHDHPPQVPGTKVFDQTVSTSGGADRLVETSIDLSAALGRSGLGHALAIVEPSPWRESYEPPRMAAWVQSTRLAIDAHVDNDSLVAFVSELANGEPARGVSLELRPFGITAKTDDRGMATLALAPGSPRGVNYLVARRGDDVAVLADDSGWWSEQGSWHKTARPRQLAWYVTDDRKLYKPGEEVSIKGWLRILDPDKNGDITGLEGQVTMLNYRVTDSRGNQLLTGLAPVDALGGFDTRFKLPTTPNLGMTAVTFEARGGIAGVYTHPLRVEEFRRPEFEVSAKATPGHGQPQMMVGGDGDVTVTAKYYAGGPLPGAAVHWQVEATQTTFTPPNRDDYVFGSWKPWWAVESYAPSRGRGIRPIGFQPAKAWSLDGKTDAIGAHTMHLEFLSARPPLPMSVTGTALVTDVNRQAWSASSTMIVHPASLYVGLKAKRPFVDKGTPFELDVIGVDLDGKPAPGARIDVAAVRLDWEYKHGAFATKEVDPQSCQVVAASAPSACSFATHQGGEYQVTATIVDAQGRPNQTQLTFWVAGGERPPARDVEQERVQVIPDHKEYAPGSTAELLVLAPFFPAEGIVTWRRSGIVKAERISFDGPSRVIKVPITDAMTPNLIVQVDLVGAAARLDDRGVPDPKLPKRPAYAVGSIDLPVPPRQRTLAVSVTPSAGKLAPGESAKLAVRVTDAQGRPVADAETAVIVVDEAILALTDAQFADPVDVFYTQRGADTRDTYARSHVKLVKPALDQLARGEGRTRDARRSGETIAIQGSAPAMEPASPGAAPTAVGRLMMAKADSAVSMGLSLAPQTAPIALRSDFNPLAAFAPAVHTDAAGKAMVEIKLPDNLTRYRVVALAVAGGTQFGKGESAITARLPVMVRPSPPRFLNFGDTFKLPVVVQNQTDAPMTVRVAVRTTNAALTDGAGRELSVPANDRVEVQFPAAAEMAGTARFQIVGVAGAYSDAAELALPVWTPATTEAFATYGVVDDAAPVVKQPVALPGKVVTQFGGVEVSTSSTNLAALTDAMVYLVQYPFECAEQRSSRILGIAALRDVLDAFHAKDLPSPAALAASVATDIEHLSQMQNDDGGFAFWDRGYPSEPYLTVYVARALGLAQQKHFAVPSRILERARPYLRTIEQHYPAFYSQDVRWAISAFALYTRKQLGDTDVGKARQLIAEAGVEKLSMEANGWLLGALAQEPAAAAERKAIVRHALNKVSETAGAAAFTTGYGDGAHVLLASDRRVDAVMLESLIAEQPDLDLIPKVVTGLLAHRKAGRWLNTQENGFALIALDRYFQTYEKVTPDFVAKVWLGNDYAGDHAFRGRSTDTYAIAIPMAEVATHDKSALTLQKDGKGRMYYRIGMTYAPASLQLAAADHGFVVERRYEAVDDPKDVTRGPDGAWHIKAGARVRVRLTMVNESRRYHVALVDPLPAGLETMNPALAVTGPIPRDPSEQGARGPYWWWYGPWYEHQNLRDERVEAFASLLWEGVHKYDYVARATTPGNFVVPPPKAEEMYMPETFGRGASDRVIIE